MNNGKIAAVIGVRKGSERIVNKNIKPFNDTSLLENKIKTLKKVKKTGMAVLLDIGEKDNGHPGNKKDVGKRLALLALDNDYNHNVISSGPLYEDHRIVDDYIEISFTSVGSGLTSKGQLKNFEIAGANKKFYAATAKIVGNKVRVRSKKIKSPKHVRYAWKNWAQATLFNKEGLPASSFESDY